MDLPKPPSPHDLRQGTRVVPIGLVRHRLHGGVGLSRLDADRAQAGLAQSVVKPGGQ